MDSQVIVALITAGVALVTALVAVYQQRDLQHKQRDSAQELERLRDQLAAERAREQRERDAEQQLNLYREPLLKASRDIYYRVRNIRGNIQEGTFLVYLNSPDEHRRRMTMLGTLYKFGAYWGMVDSLLGTVSLLELERHAATSEVANLLTQIETTFSSDSLDVGQLLMIWRDEQSAVAELMQRKAPEGATLIGFATFVERYTTDFAEWFATFESALRLPGIELSPRLEVLEGLLGQLVKRLESDRT